MANEKYLKMVKMGEWLEQFLNPDSKVWEYKQLAQNAIKLLKIDFEVGEKDYGIEMLEMLEAQKPPIKKLYFPCPGRVLSSESRTHMRQMIIAALKEYGNAGINTFKDWVDPEALKYVQSLQQSDKYHPPPVIGVFNKGMDYYFAIYDYKQNIISCFKHILNTDLPYMQSLPKMPESGGDSDSASLIFDELIKSYNGVIEKMLYKQNELCIIKMFTKEFYFRPVVNYPPLIPWAVLISRIFFDFLLSGGEDYFGFCAYCGKFFSIKRKGQKKFCSDICRTSNQHK